MSGIDSQIDNFFDNSHLPEDKPELQEDSLDLSAHNLIKEEEEIVVNMDGGVGGSWETKQLSPVEYYAQRLSRKVETEHTHVDLFAPQPEPNTPSFVGIHKPSTEYEPTQMTEEDFGNRLRMVEKRISDVALTMGEVKSMTEENTTLVHGIGASGDGSNSPGSGEVMLARLDDVDVSEITPGQGLAWDGKRFTNVDVAGGTNFAVVTSVDSGAGIEVTGTYATGEVVVALQANTSNIDLTTYQGPTTDSIAITSFATARDIDIPILVTQEDANIAFHNILEDLDTRLTNITEDGELLPITGGDMTGAISVPKDQITNPDHVITSEYADDRYAQLAGATFVGDVTVDGKPLIITARDGAFVTRVLSGANQAGSAMTYNGQIANNNHVANKGYVDGQIETAVTDLEQQIQNLDESNLTSHILSYDYTISSNPPGGQFTSSDIEPGNITFFDFNGVDNNNRMFPELYPGDLLSVRPSTQGSDVQNYKVTTGPTPDSVIVTAEATTPVNLVPGDTYVVTLTHAFEGFATKSYVDSNTVAKSGDTMTGKLTLSGAPTSNNHAATKKYVDDRTSSTGSYLPLQGGTLMGALIMGSSSASMRRIGTGSNVQTLALGRGNNNHLEFSSAGDIRMTIPLNMQGTYITNMQTPTGNTPSAVTNVTYVETRLQETVNALKDDYLLKTGGKITGRLEIEGNLSNQFRLKTTMSTGSSMSCFSVMDASNYDILRVTGHGHVKVGRSLSSPFIATEADDVVTKKYFDDNVATQVRTSNPPGMPFRYYDGDYNILYAGQFSMKNDGQVTFHRENADGQIWCHVDSDWGDAATNNQLMTIYDIDSSGRWYPIVRKEFMKTRIGYNYGTSTSTNRVVELKNIYSKGGKRSDLVNGRKYYIVVSGLF